MKVAQKILHAMQEDGMETEALSRQTGIPEQKLHDILHGKRQLHFEDYAAVCHALGVPVSAFLEPCAPETHGGQQTAPPRRG